MLPEEPFEHIRRIRREKFGWAEDGTKLPNPLELDLRQALKHLAEDLYSKKHHFILELIQNAEDNTCLDGDSPMLSFQLLAEDPTGTPGADGCLVLLNNEQGFQPAQVQSLCAVGQSTKTKREGYIGEKGIGFKSVFQVTNRPHVFSNGYQLHFRHPADDDELGYIVPHWLQVVPELVKQTNARTAILLPLIPGDREAIAAQLLAIAPETILFLTKLSAFHIDTGADKRIVLRDPKERFVTLHSGDSESCYFVAKWRCPRPSDLEEEKRLGIDYRELTIALPLNATEKCSGRVFAFLPTECDSGLPFLVNADFLLTANREAILDGRPWNQWLRNCIAPAFTGTFKNLLQHEAQRHDAYRFIPLQSALRQQMGEFYKPVVDSIHKALRDESCVWTQAGVFVRPGDAWFAGIAERALVQTCEPPSRLTAYGFVAPELERLRERLRPLGVRDFTTVNSLEVINDPRWLEQRVDDWWEAAFQLLADRKVTAATVAPITLLRCADGVCRKPDVNEVFLNGEGTVQLPAEGPKVHLLAPSLQQRLQQKPAVWAWLNQTLRLVPLSVRGYVVSRLLPWMQAQTGEGAGERLVAATRFMFANSATFDEATWTALKAQMPWVVAGGRVASATSRTGKETVTPETVEGSDGWHWLFISQSETEVAGRPHFRDWACPGWLRDLASVETTQNGAQKVAALERWVMSFRQDGSFDWRRETTVGRIGRNSVHGLNSVLHCEPSLGFRPAAATTAPTLRSWRRPNFASSSAIPFLTYGRSCRSNSSKSWASASGCQPTF